MSCGPARNSCYTGYSSGGCRGNPCGGPICLPGAPAGESTYTQSSSEDSSYNNHVHDHCHTLNVYNHEDINVTVQEVEHYDQNVNYQNGGRELVCDENNVSGDYGSFGLGHGFGGYQGPTFQVGAPISGYSGYGRGGSCGAPVSRGNCSVPKSRCG